MLEVRRLLTRGVIFGAQALLGLGVMLELTWAHAVIISTDGHTTEGIVRFVISGSKSMPGVDDPAN